MKFSSGILLLFLLSSSMAQAGYYHPRPYYHDDGITPAKAAVAIGCLAAVGYGIYKFCDWLFTPSDEKVLQRGLDALQQAHGFDPMIGFIEFHFSSIPDNIRDQKRLVQTINEALLYDFAISYKKETSIDTVITNMNNAISCLQSAHAALADRMKKLRVNNGSPAMINNMQQVDQEIVGLVCKLEFVHEYFTHHRNYYSLFEAETRILRAYDFELSAINQYQANMAPREYMKEAIKASVMKHAGARAWYPYMQYVDRVQADYDALTYGISRLAYQYANRLNAASALLHNIKIIHATVMAEDAYHQELRDYKKEQLEKQRIEAEKAHAAAAAAQASAMQQQAWAMQNQANAIHHQNQLQAQQIRVDSERNAIMATQTLVNAFNPQPQVNVYV